MRKTFLIPIIVFLGFFVFSNFAAAKTIYVPDNYLTIQEAVNGANSGDTIIVRDGIYNEIINVNKYRLTIKSQHGAAVTIVQSPSELSSPDYIFHIRADYVTIDGFTIKERENTIATYGIRVYKANHSGILNNNIAGFREFGIYLYYSSNCKVKDNYVYSNSHQGIDLVDSNNNIIENNNVTSNGGAFFLEHSNNNILNRNNMSNNRFWGLAFSGDNNLIINNKIENNYGDGLIFSGDGNNGNVVAKNIIKNNHVYGILGSENNTIFLNDSVDNTRNSCNLANSVCTWHSSKEITYIYNNNAYTNYLGNYWGDYTGADVNGDGIGDSPYNIEGNYDNYSLMLPFENYGVALLSQTWSFNRDFQYNLDNEYSTIEGTGHLEGTTTLFDNGTLSIEGRVSLSGPLPSQIPDIYLVATDGEDKELNKQFVNFDNFSYGQISSNTYQFSGTIPNVTKPINGGHYELSVLTSSGTEKYHFFVNTNSQINNHYFPLMPQALIVESWTEVSKDGDCLVADDGNGSPNGASSLKCFPAGWILKIMTNNGQPIEREEAGIKWRKVVDVTDGVSGWMKADSLNYDSTKQADWEKKTEKLDPAKNPGEGGTVSTILEAVNRYYDNLDTGSSLYGTGGGRDKNNYFQRFIAGSSFPKELILAILAQESGPKFDNEVCSSAKDGGIGTMQITSAGYKGLGSGLDNYLKKNDCDAKTGWIGEFSKYYSNTSQGIHANIKDGFRVLQEKYKQAIRMVENPKIIAPCPLNIKTTEITCLDLMKILTTWGYNGFGKDENGQYSNYLGHIANKLKTINTYFAGIINDNNRAEIELLSDKLVLANNNKMIIKLNSPGELQIIDSQGRITGLVKGEIKEEVSLSVYDENEKGAVIFFPSDSYRYNVVGTEEGKYGLDIISVENGVSTEFSVNNVSISNNLVHQYNIDWQTVFSDINKDGVVNILDLIFVRERLNQDINADDNKRADINQDGKINILDLIAVKENLNKTSFSFSKSWPIPGDANLDCKVNILDLIFIRSHLDKDPKLEDNWQADVNQDGKINALDLIFVRSHLGTSCK